ncbi:MAG: sensor histidine kinase [Saprospiraceae bacterium]|nr:MAG: sensor histidine kinase [Saprospiraceae bacterium]
MSRTIFNKFDVIKTVSPVFLIIASLLMCHNTARSSQGIYQTDSLKNSIITALNSVNQLGNEAQKASFYQKLAEYYEAQSRQDSAISYYQKSSIHYRQAGDDKMYYEILSKLGFLNYNVYNYKFAIEYLKEVTAHYKKKKMYLPYVKAMNQLGLAYSGINDDINARQCFIATLEINNNILKDTHLILENKILIIQNDIKTGNLERALSLANHNEKVAKRFGDQNQLAQTLFQLGRINFKLENYQKAENYLQDADSMMVKAGSYRSLPELYKILSQTYIELDKKEMLLPTLEKYYSVVDKIKNTEIVKSSQEIAQRFDSENKDQMIKQLENENELKTINSRQQRIMIYILIFAFMATILAVYLIYRGYTSRLRANQIIQRQKSELQDKQLKQIEQESQIKVMESMLMGQEAERNRIGKDLHDSLGAILSTIKLQMSADANKNGNIESPAMKRAKEMIDDACEEVRKISRDMMPITLSKYGLHTALEELVDKYTFEGGPTVVYQSFGINRISDKELDLFVYRIIQELINNSIKHADAQEIIVQINYLEDLMMITVEDDGKGFEYSTTGYSGMGLKNVEYRTQYLRGKVTFDSSPGSGTIVVVEIPVHQFVRNEEAISGQTDQRRV